MYTLTKRFIAGARPGFGSLFTQGLPEEHPGFNPYLQE
jgi:hypothetical protein